MEGSAAGFAERLFGSQNQIAIMDHLAEWTRLHLDARFASAQLYDHNRKRLQSRRATGICAWPSQPIRRNSDNIGDRVCASRAPADADPNFRRDARRGLDSVFEFLRKCRVWRRPFHSVAVESWQPDRRHILSFFRPREADKKRNEFRPGKLRIRQRCDYRDPPRGRAIALHRLDQESEIL